MRTSTAEGIVLVGSLLILIAGVGVLRFRPALSRLHALTKASTLGVVLVLVGAAVASDRPNDWTSLVLAAALQMATSPISAGLISRSTFLVSSLDDSPLPETSTGAGSGSDTGDGLTTNGDTTDA